MTSVELLRRVRLIELRALRLVQELASGPYRSVFRGRGLEFDEIRPYQPGDDVRSIDWHATARTGTVQIKKHVEERCQTLLLAIDVSASGEFGSASQSKRELAAELAAVLAMSAVMNNDRVGLLLFTDSVERFLPPGTGRRHAVAVVAAVLGHEPRSRGTSIRRALATVGQALRRRATVFLISDFIDDDYQQSLRVASRRHDLVAFRLRDRAECELPSVGWLVCEDAETGEVVEVSTGDPAFRHAFAVHREECNASFRQTCRQGGADSMTCETGAVLYPALLRFFEERQRRRIRPGN
jgi:uncharacterized protein (DUF58 family)